MSHVDDGLLEAWLDRDRSGLGPDEVRWIERHLAACAECRERLASATALRDRAELILAGAAPRDTPAPGFEEIAARAGGTPKAITPARQFHPGRRRLVAVAWAASFLGALGLGWLAREAMRTDPIALLESGADVVAVQEAESPAVSRAGEAATAAEPVAPPVANLPPPPGARTATADATLSTAEPVAENSLPDPAAAAAAVPPAIESRVPTGADSAPQSGDAPLAFQPGLDRVDLGPATAGIQRRTAPAADAAGAPVAAARAASPPPPEPAPGAAAVAEPTVTPVSWIPADLAQAERRLGFAPVTAPDLAIARVELHPTDELRLVRVVHTLDDGSALVLTQWPAADDDSAAAANAIAGGSAATVRRGDLIVSAAAPIDVARLESLIPPAPGP